MAGIKGTWDFGYKGIVEAVFQRFFKHARDGGCSFNEASQRRKTTDHGVFYVSCFRVMASHHDLTKTTSLYIPHIPYKAQPQGDLFIV